MKIRRNCFINLFIGVNFAFFHISCTNNNKPEISLTKKEKIEIKSSIIIKNFISKKGIETQLKEYYITYQNKNYFIKLCESNIEKKTLDNYFLNDENISKTLSMEVEIKNGFWDICEIENENFQSRIGDYIIINKIIN